MEKPNRFLIGRVSAYAEEASAYLRRRRINRRPFARVHYPGGRSSSFEADSEVGRALFRAAADLIDAAR
jgi:hypothetical protein